MLSATPTSDDDDTNSASEQSSPSGRQGAAPRSINQQNHSPRSGSQSSAPEQRKSEDESDSDQGTVTEIRTVRSRSRRDDEPPNTPAPGVHSAPLPDPSIIEMARQLPPLPSSVVDETNGRYDERDSTADIFKSITAERANFAKETFQASLKMNELADNSWRDDPRAALEYFRQAREMARASALAAEGARDTYEAAVASEQRHQRETILATRLLEVRGACIELRSSAECSVEISEPAKVHAVELWKRADTGLDTLNASFTRSTTRSAMQVRVEVPDAFIARLIQESAQLITQALGHVGDFLGYMWELVRQLAQEALLSLTWHAHHVLLHPFLPLPHAG